LDTNLLKLVRFIHRFLLWWSGINFYYIQYLYHVNVFNAGMPFGHNF
jgi:hypothetical protein